MRAIRSEARTDILQNKIYKIIFGKDNHNRLHEKIRIKNDGTVPQYYVKELVGGQSCSRYIHAST